MSNNALCRKGLRSIHWAHSSVIQKTLTKPVWKVGNVQDIITDRNYGCIQTSTKIPDFQPIFNVIVLPKYFASGALPRKSLGGLQRPQTPSWDTSGHILTEALTELRAQGPDTPQSATASQRELSNITVPMIAQTYQLIVFIGYCLT